MRSVEDLPQRPQCRHRRRHRPGRRDDARHCSPSANFPVAVAAPVRLGALGRPTVALAGPHRSPSKTPRPPIMPGSTSSSSPPAARPRRRWRPKVAAAGAIVIDNSSAWRGDPDVPLVVAEVNPHALHDIPKGIVANPNCTTMAAMPVLKPLHEAAGLKRLVAQHLPGGFGRRRGRHRGACRADRAAAGDGPRRSRATASAVILPEAAKWAVPIALQCRAAQLCATSRTAIPRRKSSCATRAQDPRNSRPAVSGTCVRVPVFTGHSLSINAEFERPIPPETGAGAAGRGRRVWCVTEVPNPLEATGQGSGLRRPRAARPDGRARPRAVRHRRQSAQGRGAQRGADRRGAAAAGGLNPKAFSRPSARDPGRWRGPSSAAGSPGRRRGRPGTG